MGERRKDSVLIDRCRDERGRAGERPSRRAVISGLAASTMAAVSPGPVVAAEHAQDPALALVSAFEASRVAVKDACAVVAAIDQAHRRCHPVSQDRFDDDDDGLQRAIGAFHNLEASATYRAAFDQFEDLLLARATCEAAILETTPTTVPGALALMACIISALADACVDERHVKALARAHAALSRIKRSAFAG